ncbi:PRP38 family protein, putative [Babesia bigemina]|uniref:Pre-mRNA-splicing factor 38 n=1 Tax=Babesia bigemina TaxID=5866 RepID=A0A061DDF0_BABBI|nr:PRP38 family protein, putative [Babesia bigemina]CDR97334.1 PRP38 family protein, putative [Babesia bigemina]|eukprot:XP_012769520.1 PRP38 family protein, putative [Babesia bigemina]
MYGQNNESDPARGHGAPNASSLESATHIPPGNPPVPVPGYPASATVPAYGAYYGYNGYAAYGNNYGVNYGNGPAAATVPPTPPVAAPLAPMAVPSTASMPPTTAAVSSAMVQPSAEDKLESVQRCHMHTKPDLNCKFCRKYKSAVHEMSRLAAQQSSQQPVDKPNQLPMTNSSTYNLNTLLLSNILNSEYYKSLSAINSYVDVMNELIQYADHAEPYCSTATRAPSTLFCCLHKLFTLRLTERQMTALVDCPKSPYPRCCGFLYLRFVLPSDQVRSLNGAVMSWPPQLWDWFEPYLMDDESFVVSAHPTRKTTIGEFCERLLVDDKYFNTVLPRLPMRFKNRHGPHLYSMAEHRRRRVRNLESIDDFAPGKSASAFISGDWVECTIQSVSDDYPTVTVSLTSGEEQTVDIGYVSLGKTGKSGSKRGRESESPEADGSGRKPGHVDRHRARDGSPGSTKSKEALLREFKRRESERALAVGKDYSKRPCSFKTSLSSKMDNKR